LPVIAERAYGVGGYRHQLSMDGDMLYYYAVIGRKRRDIDDACLARI
jgi:hypothetical protein